MRTKLHILVAGLLLATTGAGLADHFQNVTLLAGITNGSGYCSWAASWGDYDDDGYPDLHVSNTQLDLFRGYVSFTYRNDTAKPGAKSFTRMTSQDIGEVASDVANHWGATWIDADNDGRLDLVAYRAPTNAASGPVSSRLYLNQGGTLVSVPAGALTLPTFGSPGVWGDYDKDGFLDCYELSAGGWPNISTNQLFRGTSDLNFERVSDSVAVTSKTTTSNNAHWSDYDNDGDLDLFVANFTQPPFFFQNLGNGDFVSLTNAVTKAASPSSNFAHLAWGDYDNDGDLDLAVGGDQSPLFRNNFPGDFVMVRNFGSVWGPTWVDYDNDGWLDLYFFRGQGAPISNVLLHNKGDGTFENVISAVTAVSRWQFGSWGDYDNDGYMDLFACHDQGANALFHNLGNTNRWIKFKLRGIASNAAAIGAKVRVNATIRGQTLWQMREIQAGWTQDDLRPNFGLGDATNVDLIRIEWPSGIVQTFTNVAPGQILTVTEHQGYTGPAPSLGSSTVLPNGVQLPINEPAVGAVYTLEASTDLLSWTKLLARTSTGGRFDYTDTRAASYTRRFYRVVVP